MLMSTSKVDSIRTTLKKHIHPDTVVISKSASLVVKIEPLGFEVELNNGEPPLATVRDRLHKFLKSTSYARNCQEENK